MAEGVGEVIRVTRHTRRKSEIPCGSCDLPIWPGDTYRQLVAVYEGDAFGENYVRWIACEFCATTGRHRETWELRDDEAPSTDKACVYVRERYGLDIRAGSRVTAGPYTGTVVGATHHVYIRPDGWKRGRHVIYHPSDVALLPVASTEAA
jgi:hypothetical protein